MLMSELNDIESKAVELLGDEDFAALERRIGAVNLFEAAGLGKHEIRHSAFLSWVLDPGSPHGLGDEPLRRLLAQLFKKNEEGVPANLVVSDLNDAIVQTEAPTTKQDRKNNKRRMDILVTSEGRKMVLCIENKTDSQLHDDQLSAYREYLERNYAEYTRLCVLLAPDGFVPVEDQNDQDGKWLRLDYSDIAEVLEGIAPLAGERITLLIEDYVDLLRREGLMEDEQLDRLAIDLYQRYWKVFDWMDACKKDRDEKGRDETDATEQQLAAGLYRLHGATFDLVSERCTGRNGLEGRLRNIYLQVLDDMKKEGVLSECAPLNSTKKYLFFHTSDMDTYLRESEEKGSWGDHRTYNYWVYPSLLKPTVKFELGPWHQTDEIIDRQERLRKATRNDKEINSRATKPITNEKKFKIIASVPTGIDMSGDDAVTTDIDKEDVEMKLRNAINTMLLNERRLLAAVNA